MISPCYPSIEAAMKDAERVAATVLARHPEQLDVEHVHVDDPFAFLLGSANRDGKSEALVLYVLKRITNGWIWLKAVPSDRRGLFKTSAHLDYYWLKVEYEAGYWFLFGRARVPGVARCRLVGGSSIEASATPSRGVLLGGRFHGLEEVVFTDSEGRVLDTIKLHPPMREPPAFPPDDEREFRFSLRTEFGKRPGK